MAFSPKERMAMMREKKKLAQVESELTNLQTVVYGKMMPNSYDLEQIILGSILIDKTAMPRVLNIFVEKNPFYNETNAMIYNCILNVFNTKTNVVDRMLVYEEFLLMDEVTQKHFELNPYNLVLLCEMVSDTVNLEKHCRAILEMSVCRDIITMANRITAMAYDKQMKECIQEITNYNIGFTEATKIDFEAHTPKEFCKLFPRNRISMLFAPAKAGKTGVIFSIMDALSSYKFIDGIPVDNSYNSFWFPNEMERRAKVLYFDGEMHKDDYQQRGILHSEIIRCPVRQIDSLKSEILYHKPDFCIIDTISKYVPNLLDTRAIKIFLDSLFELRHLTAFVLVAHTPKSEFGKKLSEASVFGSVMQIAAIENLISVNKIHGIRYMKQHLSRTKPAFEKENDVLLLDKQNNFTFKADRIIDERCLFYDLKEYKHLLSEYQRYNRYKSKYEFAKEYNIRTLEEINEIFKIAKEVDYDPAFSQRFNFQDIEPF
jgi:DnaB-like helicase N terminal domain